MLTVEVASACCGYGWFKWSFCVRDDTREPTRKYLRRLHLNYPNQNTERADETFVEW